MLTVFQASAMPQYKSLLNHQVNPAYVKRLEERGMKFVGHDVDGERMEIMELQGISRFVQYFFIIPGYQHH